jgi:hypothetical protein
MAGASRNAGTNHRFELGSDKDIRTRSHHDGRFSIAWRPNATSPRHNAQSIEDLLPLVGDHTLNLTLE